MSGEALRKGKGRVARGAIDIDGCIEAHRRRRDLEMEVVAVYLREGSQLHTHRVEHARRKVADVALKEESSPQHKVGCSRIRHQGVSSEHADNKKARDQAQGAAAASDDADHGDAAGAAVLW